MRNVDREVLVGFIEEARGYLPLILDHLQAALQQPGDVDPLCEAYRHAHCIKGASSMVGLTGLSHMAYELEIGLEEVTLGKRPLDEMAAALFHQTVGQLEAYLNDAAEGRDENKTRIEEVTQAFRAWRGGEELTPPSEDNPEAILDGGNEVTPPAQDLLDSVESLPPSEEVSPELLEVFTLEAEDHLRTMSSCLPQLRDQPENKELVQKIRRGAHSLKGTAAMVGFANITKLAHRMEDLLDLMYEGQMAVTGDLVQLLLTSTDALEDMATGKADESVVRGLYAQFTQLLSQTAAEEQAAEPAEEEDATPLVEALAAAVAGSTPAPTKKATQDANRKSGAFVRVPLERLDDLVKLVSELVIARSAFEQRLSDYAHQVDELQLSAARLKQVSSKLETEYEAATLASRGRAEALPFTGPVNRVQALLSATSHGFDELEFDRYTGFHLLSRALSETTSDIQTIGNELGSLSGDFESHLNRQARLSSEVQDKLMRVRMVPLAMLASRLHRTVRNVATQQGKQVELILEGEDTELDKTVLEEMADPLMHLLRNAVDHGIEPPELRQSKGKPAQGIIRLRAFHEGTQVVIQISDDGNGVDAQAVRAVAVSGGFVSNGDAARMSDEDLRSLVFLPGFSTAKEISEVSGRGVGLDIVKANVNKLKGTLTLDSRPGEGTTFLVRLPLTLAITKALLVKAHNQVFALPLGDVKHIMRLEDGRKEMIGEQPIVRVAGKAYPLVTLGKALNLKQPADDTVKRHPVLLLDAGGKQMALVVDQLLGGREIVIKTLGTHVRQVHGVTGATLMGDGSVVLILNSADLLRTPGRTFSSTPTVEPRATPRGREALRVMVVDDSPSVRRVVSNLLKNAGWTPILAKDGLDALEILHRDVQQPDLILLDVEMPRMDGYELLSTLRAQENYAGIPVLMVTSRAGEKHRRKAVDLGASGYLVKPYQDEVLLSTIRKLARQTSQVATA